MAEIRIVRTVPDLRAWRRGLSPDRNVGLVPTMGAIHDGHLSLARAAVAQCGATVASIFVNPIQFGPNEDLGMYPRPFARDVDLLQGVGVDAVFAPEPDEMYPADASTYVVEEDVSAGLCGRFRPGHFRGVATVVLKLFNQVQPDRAYFGQKDAQQCAVLKRMVRDLDVSVEVVVCPTVREADGLAMSSRNAYLSAEDRVRALALRRSLVAAERAWTGGERSAAVLRDTGMAVLAATDGVRAQYWDVVHPDTLEVLDTVDAAGALMAAAVFVGQTRLIDNLVLPGS